MEDINVYSKEICSKLAKDFEKSVITARNNQEHLIWGKDIDGVEIYVLPVTAPYHRFKFVDKETKNELIYNFKPLQNDWYYIFETVIKIARIFRYYFQN